MSKGLTDFSVRPLFVSGLRDVADRTLGLVEQDWESYLDIIQSAVHKLLAWLEV
jgi:hypothetical protein